MLLFTLDMQLFILETLLFTLDILLFIFNIQYINYIRHTTVDIDILLNNK